MACPEIISPNRQRRRIDFRHYALLHLEGRRLIASWFQRAWEERHCPADKSFEPFLYAWYAFNGWAACVTDTDRDRDIIDTLASDQTIRDDFAKAIQNNPTVSARVTDFSALLPIFDVKSLNRRGILSKATGNRQERGAYYLSQGANQYEPRCWQRHHQAGEAVPVDWAHIVNALYKVRCNLFHGLKAAHSEMDETVVHSAYLVLATFIAETGYLHT